MSALLAKHQRCQTFVCQEKVPHSGFENTSVTEVQDTDNRSVLGRRKRPAKQTGVVADRDSQRKETSEKKGYISEWVYQFGFGAYTLQR